MSYYEEGVLTQQSLNTIIEAGEDAQKKLELLQCPNAALAVAVLIQALKQNNDLAIKTLDAVTEMRKDYALCLLRLNKAQVLQHQHATTIKQLIEFTKIKIITDDGPPVIVSAEQRVKLPADLPGNLVLAVAEQGFITDDPGIDQTLADQMEYIEPHDNDQ